MARLASPTRASSSSRGGWSIGHRGLGLGGLGFQGIGAWSLIWLRGGLGFGRWGGPGLGVKGLKVHNLMVAVNMNGMGGYLKYASNICRGFEGTVWLV